MTSSANVSTGGPVSPKGPGLWPPGVALGGLFMAASFAALFGCFINNYLNRPPSPAEELAINNAAMTPNQAMPTGEPRRVQP